MSRKIILQFKSFEICEQKICTKMSDLNNGILALETLLVQKHFVLWRVEAKSKIKLGEPKFKLFLYCEQLWLGFSQPFLAWDSDSSFLT